MKPSIFVAAVLVLAALGIAVAWAVDRQASATGAPVLDVAGRKDVRQVERRVEELSRELDALRLELSSLRAEPRPLRDEPVAAPAAASPGADHAAPTPLWYLESYERSFDGGGSGSEYFRLAVAAYARELYEPIDARIRDGNRPLLLRQRLVEILGDTRFRGDRRVAALLGWVVGSSSERVLADGAVSAFAIAGDARTSLVLEHEVWRIPWTEVQQRAIDVVVALAGDEANAAVLRLMRGAPDDAQLIRLVSLLKNFELVTSLEAFQLASRESQQVRLAAALRVAEFRSVAFSNFVDAWAAVERDPEVLAALGRAREEQRALPRWSAAQATGPPDANADNDDPRAWASRQGDMGEQWIELMYAPALRASGVRIWEVNAAGAVSAVIGIDGQGNRHELWSGLDPTASPGVFQPTFPTTTFAVSRLRIVLDTDRTSGWNEIDAVELFGPDGSAWASQAVASSEYGR